jgi:arsenate reductase (thioredoxin)
VITMVWGDAYQVFPGKRYLDWELPDPAGKSIEFLTAIDA